MKIYAGEYDYTVKNNRYVKTGEFRPPKKGEYYLSGAIPTAYKAFSDMEGKYEIMRPATQEELRCPCCQQPKLIERESCALARKEHHD